MWIGFRTTVLPIARLAAMLLTCAPWSPAAAESVSVQLSHDTAESTFAQRIASELAIEGYTVEEAPFEGPMPCEGGVPPAPPGARAWVRLDRAPLDREGVTAVICYESGSPAQQQTTSLSPRRDMRELALAVVEALNGLRATLPPRSSEPLPSSEPVPRLAPERSHENRILLGPALLWTSPGKGPALAATAGAHLGATESVSLFMDSHWPVQSTELSGPAAAAALRLAWLRLGPSIRVPFSDFEFTGAALVGPALTWATATRVEAPRLGATDVALSAVWALRASVEYQTKTPLFAYVAASATALLPRPVVDLGGESPVPLRWVLVEGSLGLGVRWGNSGTQEAVGHLD